MDGNIIVADEDNHRVQVFRPDGTFVRSFGTQGSGAGQMSYPIGVAVDRGSPGHEPQNIYPTLPYWQSVKNIQITYKCSQMLMIEPQIFMPNPYAASIYGCIR